MIGVSKIRQLYCFRKGGQEVFYLREAIPQEGAGPTRTIASPLPHRFLDLLKGTSEVSLVGRQRQRQDSLDECGALERGGGDRWRSSSLNHPIQSLLLLDTCLPEVVSGSICEYRAD